MQLTNEQSQIDDRRFTRLRVNASWLIKLRWVAATGQLLTILAVNQFLGIEVPILPLTIALLVTSLSNLGLMYWFNHWQNRSPTERAWRLGDQVLALVMTLDLFSLTSMLYFTGGPNNPFSLFFFVNLSLCAVVLTNEKAWALTLLSLACFVFVMVDFVPLAGMQPDAAIDSIYHSRGISVTHAGLITAFTACASVIVYFMTRVTQELRASEHERWRAEANQARSEKLQALGTLAAGAAHELSTPLSTIAVVAREVEDEIKALTTSEHVNEDIKLIRAELDRCRHILDRMNAEAGQVSGEGMVSITADELLEDALEGLANRDRVTFDESPALQNIHLNVPRGVLAQAIRGLVQNALDASEPGQKITLATSLTNDQLGISITDRGHGMSEEVMKRISEPFFTTKEPGKGMGLGLFLARTVVEQLGGTIELDSKPEIGTEAIIRLPISVEQRQDSVPGRQSAQ